MEVQKIYRPYNPSRQDANFLENTFTGYKHLLDDLISSIEEQSKKQTHQHWLLIGPRGIGKSHIIALLYNKIIMNSALKDKWLILWFPEEAAGIITLRDFMEKVLKFSREELKKKGESKESQKFTEILEATFSESNDLKALNRITAFLLDWKKRRNQKFLVLLENADRVVGNRIAKKLMDEKWLRDLLMNKDLLLLIATSPTFFKQILNKDHPLYELFKIEIIEDLNFKESLQMLIKYAKEEGRRDLVRAFETKSNRIKALHTLTGGNPRLLVMFYILIQDSLTNIRNLEVGFYNLLEELTPYFQVRLAQLNAQQEKILVAFAEGPELLTPAEVSKKLRWPTNLVTAHLNGLQYAGFIKRIEKPIKGRKGTLYRLSESICRYWYQMNSERDREMADIFIKFIVLYYTYDEIEKIYTSKLSTFSETKRTILKNKYAFRELEYIKAAMQISKQKETNRLQKILEELIDKNKPIKEIDALFKKLLKLDPNNLPFLNKYAIFINKKGDLKGAINYFRKVLKLAQKKENLKYIKLAYYNLGLSLLRLAGLRGDEELYKKSIKKFALAVEYKRDYYAAYHNWGLALSGLAELKGDEKLYKESFKKFALAVEYKKDYYAAYHTWGLALSELANLRGDEELYKEGFKKFVLAVEYRKDYYAAYHTWGIALSKLAELREDEKLYKEGFKKFALAVEYKRDYYAAYHNWGIALSELAELKGDEKLYEESIKKFALAVKDKEISHYAYSSWGLALSELAKLKGDEKLYEESFKRFAVSVNRKNDYYVAYYNWGFNLFEVAKLSGKRSIYLESFEKFLTAWNTINKLKWLNHHLMINTGLMTVLVASILEKVQDANKTYMDVILALRRTTNLKVIIPHFFAFFISLLKMDKLAIAKSYFDQLIDSKYKKVFNDLIPLGLLFKYLEGKDSSIIRRQPPEIQGLLTEIINEIEKETAQFLPLDGKTPAP